MLNVVLPHADAQNSDALRVYSYKLNPVKSVSIANKIMIATFNKVLGGQTPSCSGLREKKVPKH